MHSLDPQPAVSDRIEVLHGGRWLRAFGNSASLRERLGKMTSASLPGDLLDTFREDGAFIYLPMYTIVWSNGAYVAEPVSVALGSQVVITIEPEHGAQALAVARERLQRYGRESDAAEIFTVILDAMSDTTEALIDRLNESFLEAIIQTNAVLNSLETKGKDFGVSDVVTTQYELGEFEEVVARCMEVQLLLGRAARHVMARISERAPAKVTLFETLIADIEGEEELVDFMQQRIRVLQQTNNMALNVKQNQIVKVFSIVTAVFLPALLVSTYYSMNLAYMPILEWQFGEPMVMLMSLLLAVLPLWYIKHRGWLR